MTIHHIGCPANGKTGRDYTSALCICRVVGGEPGTLETVPNDVQTCVEQLLDAIRKPYIHRIEELEATIKRSYDQEYAARRDVLWQPTGRAGE